MRSARSPSPGTKKSNGICHNMRDTGKCKFGSKCRYSHDIPAAPATRSKSRKRSKTPKAKESDKADADAAPAPKAKAKAKNKARAKSRASEESE